MLQERRFRMKNEDINGRAYALVSEVVKNCMLQADGGFPCLEQGEICRVHEDNFGEFYIYCSAGVHSLDGQLEDNYYVGLYKA